MLTEVKALLPSAQFLHIALTNRPLLPFCEVWVTCNLGNSLDCLGDSMCPLWPLTQLDVTKPDIWSFILWQRWPVGTLSLLLFGNFFWVAFIYEYTLGSFYCNGTPQWSLISTCPSLYLSLLVPSPPPPLQTPLQFFPIIHPRLFYFSFLERLICPLI